MKSLFTCGLMIAALLFSGLLLLGNFAMHHNISLGSLSSRLFFAKAQAPLEVEGYVGGEDVPKILFRPSHPRFWVGVYIIQNPPSNPSISLSKHAFYGRK